VKSLARLRRRPVTACVGAAIVLGSSLAAAVLTTGLSDATAARAPQPPNIPRLTFNQAVTPATNVTVGSTITYTATVRNTGKLVTGWSIADTLPDGVALIAAETDQGEPCSGVGPRITCTWEAVGTGVTVSAAFVVQVVVPGTLVNSIELVPSESGTTAVTAGATPPPVEAGPEGVAIRFAPRTTLASK
jgi:uncharacterized repeat protein (TIGR01451 family)